MNRNSYEIRKLLLTGLEQSITGKQFAPADYGHSKPDYPFGTIAIIAAMDPSTGLDVLEEEIVDSTNPNFDKDIIQKFLASPEMTISVNSYAESEEEASQLSYDMNDWFKRIGEFYLDSLRISVIDVESVQERNVVIQDEYERRFGFDVRLRYTRTIERRIETIETVDVNITL